jgi:hypothetical protein
MNLTNSHVKEIADKVVLESFIRQNPGLHLYIIGNLDDFFWPYTKWYGIIDNARLRSVFLIYSGSKLPVLFALEDTDKLQSENLLNSLVPKLPASRRHYRDANLPKTAVGADGGASSAN